MKKKEAIEVEVKLEPISIIDKDFSREDLNELRDKVNELIRRQS